MPSRALISAVVSVSAVNLGHGGDPEIEAHRVGQCFDLVDQRVVGNIEGRRSDVSQIAHPLADVSGLLTKFFRATGSRNRTRFNIALSWRDVESKHAK